MVVIDILQKMRAEAERLLGQLNSGSSRIYEITTAGAIVERTGQLRELHQTIAEQLGHVIHMLSGGGAQGNE